MGICDYTTKGIKCCWNLERLEKNFCTSMCPDLRLKYQISRQTIKRLTDTSIVNSLRFVIEFNHTPNVKSIEQT